MNSLFDVYVANHFFTSKHWGCKFFNKLKLLMNWLLFVQGTWVSEKDDTVSQGDLICKLDNLPYDAIKKVSCEVCQLKQG